MADCFFDLETEGEGAEGTEGTEGAQGTEKYFIVDAAAHDVDGALVIRLYTKEQCGVSKTIEWPGQVVRVYVFWPGSMDTLGQWLQWMENKWANLQEYGRG